MIFELPDGKFAVASQTFIKKMCKDKKINFDKEQTKYYNITK